MWWSLEKVHQQEVDDLKHAQHKQREELGEAKEKIVTLERNVHLFR